MSIQASSLIKAKYAATNQNSEYTVGSGSVIIDKFTATNNTVGILTLSVWLVPSGLAPTNANLIVAASISGGATKDFSELQNHILTVGESIVVQASAGNSIAIRSSGRVIS